jgi:hypothetical protein
MKKLLGILMLAGLALGGCGNNDCEDAADKVKECGAPSGSGSGDGECSGAAECVAKCVNNASCAEIKAEDLDLNSPYFKCLAACGG